MSVSEAASGVVYESVESTESAPDTPPATGLVVMLRDALLAQAQKEDR
jgi:hypothetical protein